MIPLIYLLNGDEVVASALSDESVLVSFITEIELLSFHGLTDRDHEVVEDLLANCVVSGVTDDIKRRAIEIRKRHRMRIPDALIAATALSLAVPLLTADKGFDRVRGLNLWRYDAQS